MRRLPPLNALRAFEAAARHVSFTRAAAELNVTHGAVSQQVSTLEGWLGRPLFQRTKSKLALTDEGQFLLSEAGPALDRIALAIVSLTQQQKLPILEVNAPPTFTMRWLIPRLSGFQRRRSTVEVRLTTSIEPVDFEKGHYDLAIRGAERPIPGLSCLPFLKEDILPVCSPEILEKTPLNTAADLAKHTLIRYGTEPYSWDQWFDSAHQENVRPVNFLNLGHMFVALQATLEGLGVALVPFFLVADEVAAERLCAPLGVLGSLARKYYAFYRETKIPSAQIELFAGWLKKEGWETTTLCEELLSRNVAANSERDRLKKRSSARGLQSNVR
jgi:LysR family glycine cleavage system transcriptional activator